MGFKPLKSGPCIHIYTHKDGIHNPVTKKKPTRASWNKETATRTFCFDDLLLVGQSKVWLQQLEETLVRLSDTKCMGDVSLVLGMKVTRVRKNGTLTISQAHHTSRYSRRTAWRSANWYTRPEVGYRSTGGKGTS